MLRFLGFPPLAANRRGVLSMIFCAFYTPGPYEREAARLRSSLDKFNLPHDFTVVPDAGSWRANTHKTAQFIVDMQIKHAGEPIVSLDADCYCWRYPALLFELNPADTDLAFHRRRGTELLNGAVWFANNEMSRAVAARYAQLCRENPDFRDEQQFLWKAIEELKPRWVNLPAAYCWIHDIMAEDLGDNEPVLEMLQMSREVNKTSLLPNRRARIAYLGFLGNI